MTNEIIKNEQYYHKKKQELHKVRGFFFYSVYKQGKSWLRATKDTEITRANYYTYVAMTDDSGKIVNSVLVDNFFKKYLANKQN